MNQKEPRDMSFQETFEYYHKISELMKDNLTEEDLIGLQDWAVRGYDDGEFPITKGRILRLIREVRELRELCNKAVVLIPPITHTTTNRLMTDF